MIVKGKAHEKHVVLNKREIAECFAPRKYEIDEVIAELKLSQNIPLKGRWYNKPNYEKIKNSYAANAARLLKLQKQNEKENYNYTNTNSKLNHHQQRLPPTVDIISNLYVNLLKEIILCDYNHHIDYNPKSNDDLLSLAVVAKKRRKVRRLLSKRERQPPSKVMFVSNPSNNINERVIFDPDDDEEEREERRKLVQEKIRLEQEIGRQCEEDIPSILHVFKEAAEMDWQLEGLSISLIKKQQYSIEEIQQANEKEIEELKLGLKIADIVKEIKKPEWGLTFDQLLRELLLSPTSVTTTSSANQRKDEAAIAIIAAVKEKEGKEHYYNKENIVNAIETTQLYILTRFLKARNGRIIRIFPIALPSKKDGGIVRVFNGYKREYIGRILKEFITTT
jgi:hypothetical protein